MKNYYIITIFILILSYSSNAQSDRSDEQKIKGHFTYFEPIFFHQKPNKTNYVYRRFEEISIIALDSVLKRKKPQYRIDEKDETSMPVDIKNELISIFNSVSKKKPNIEFSPAPASIY